MASGFDDTEEEGGTLEAPLEAIDSELNIFALANGLDLYRNVSDRPDRVLEWYREGMERRIVLRAEAPDRYVVRVGATRRRQGVETSTEAELSSPLTAQELADGLRPLLAEGIDRANGLGQADLSDE